MIGAQNQTLGFVTMPGPGSPTDAQVRGIVSSATRTGLGQYRYDLSQEIDYNTTSIVPTVLSSSLVQITIKVNPVSATRFDVVTLSAAETLIDATHQVRIDRVLVD